MDPVSLKSVTKRFAGKSVVEDVDLEVSAGEFMALLGPSGCGKTTLLRLLAGFESPDQGIIKIGAREMARAGGPIVPAEERGVGMVFQSYALWPHMTVRENVEYALKVRKLPPQTRMQRVERALQVVGLPDRHDAMPETLSGGQRQRVALARCLAMEPAVILMDEPLANLDVHLRDSLQSEFHRLHRELGATILYITHDQGEAMALADRIAVMDHGRIQQVAAPRQLYSEPATAMVADFVGRGMVLPVTDVAVRDGTVGARLWDMPVKLRGSDRASGLACLRSEDLALTDTGIAARIERAVFEGVTTMLHCRPAAAPGHLLRVAHRGSVPEEGSEVKIAVHDGWLLPTVTEQAKAAE
ncbi:MAG TPA: ABC transporter ATP-binding protein [Dongiaceae bacterium]|jgi:iron(III) transport system ATP-binding protein